MAYFKCKIFYRGLDFQRTQLDETHQIIMFVLAAAAATTTI